MRTKSGERRRTARAPDPGVNRIPVERRVGDRLERMGGHARVEALENEGIARSFARHRDLALARMSLPGLAGALVITLGGHPGSAIIFATAMWGLGGMRNQLNYPLHLMTATRFALALMPALVVAAVVAVVLAVPPDETNDLAREALLGAPIAFAIAFAIELGAPAWMRKVPIRIAVLDDPVFALGLGREMEENGIDHVELVGWIDTTKMGRRASDGRDAQALRAIVAAAQIEMVVRGRSTQDSAFEGERPSAAGFAAVAEALIDLPVRMIDGNQLYEQLFGHVPMGTMDAGWYLFMKHPRYQSARRLPVRILDLVVVAPLVPLLIPLAAASALAIKLADRESPILFRQVRIGEGGEPFEIFKLRTMGPAACAGEARWSGADDMRVTAVGKVLRRLHLDELPQLVNVLVGEMSLVGPRPEQPEMVEELETVFPHYSRRHLIKPGVTGWAQVRCGYAGSTLGTAWKTCHDLYYFKHRSLLANLALMLETGVIAAKDTHRPLRAPDSQFLFGQELGIELDPEERAGLGEVVASLN